ncbi:NADPH-dependent 2,4-dienoyl-CoA reductase/sulfur reductase-like enzyme [Amycolatopsis lexingtonensis]|uniref:NADPH-dependent 2,4-dienoyl-CoA reductase/sulfur reductase-like enzyme n=1 Tax=Amycolatopsis lexingtonensis TaxID=218822 RepID=A0ABR9I3I8_9PSEU|nr:FAD-dependent oxidoreductase [Amycolatopsis lexingtonensis]MBE1497751.1 NADPH-dependent 2,4-dienoyl-CoA reductase/sulfur reductase-like enzyme [Amycolatopsis lexingtonensis]
MSEPRKIVIVGAGLGGASAAAALRERGYTGEVLLMGADPHRPYELPPLSKGILLGNTDEPDWVHEEKFYAEKDVRFAAGVTATRVELGARLVLDDAGGEHRYDRLVLATGSRPRTLPVPGGDLPGLYTLRTLDDALKLRSAFAEAERVVIVGAGWIGSEAAAAARTHNADVTVVDPVPVPLANVVGETIGGVFRDLHVSNGVNYRLGEQVAEITGGPDGVRGVRLGSGEELRADVVLIAVGAAPRVELAHAAGLELSDDGGVCVDAGLRTAAPDVYAVGDIAAHFHPRYGRRIRVEHWANAKDQGTHVAQNLLGENEPFLASPYFFTDQYDLGCEYRGLADPVTDELVVRGDLAAREFTAFWLRDGEVAAAMNVNMWDDGDALGTLVDGRAKVTAEQLKTADLASLT